MNNNDWRTWPDPTCDEIQLCLDNAKYWDSDGWKWAMSHITYLLRDNQHLKAKLNNCENRIADCLNEIKKELK